MKYGEELRESIIAEKKRKQDAIDRRMDRINNCETDMDDCFISQHVEEDAIRACNMQLKILDGDGCMDITAIFDNDGNEVRTHWFTNKWGRDTIVANGVFASSLKALLKKTGWTEKVIRVPAWTKFIANGSGMCGVMNGSTEVVRWHTNMKTGEYVGYPE
ncbi:MAG: hypothetical protein ACI4I1_06645 [Oscillospiraceae bacterium]